MVFKKLYEDSSNKEHIFHGSFKDLQTFLDPSGNPYNLKKSDFPSNNSSNSGSSSNSNSNANNNSNSNSSNSNSNNQNNSSSNNSNNNQNNNSSSDNQSNNDSNKKTSPDPNAIYVDIRSMIKYKWDRSSNKFIKFEEVNI